MSPKQKTFVQAALTDVDTHISNVTILRPLNALLGICMYEDAEPESTNDSPDIEAPAPKVPA